MNTIVNGLGSDNANHDDDAVWIEIPPGYLPLPTDNIDVAMHDGEVLLGDLVPEKERAALSAISGVFAQLLQNLAARNVVYCGIGRHLSAVDSVPVTSSLTVAFQRFSEEKRNPTLILKDLVEAKAADDETGQADVVQLDRGPVLFFESSRVLPTPQIPGQPEVPEGATTPIYQLQATVPSHDGTKMATLDFSTTFETHGPEFRTMMVTMADTVRFEEPQHNDENTGRSSKSIQQALG